MNRLIFERRNLYVCYTSTGIDIHRKKRERENKRVSRRKKKRKRKQIGARGEKRVSKEERNKISERKEREHEK